MQSHKAMYTYVWTTTILHIPNQHTVTCIPTFHSEMKILLFLVGGTQAYGRRMQQYWELVACAQTEWPE
jgi:hypothetical protein